MEWNGMGSIAVRYERKGNELRGLRSVRNLRNLILGISPKLEIGEVSSPSRAEGLGTRLSETTAELLTSEETT
eukprot:6890083-Pyramimonas_sp.AAC.1